MKWPPLHNRQTTALPVIGFGPASVVSAGSAYSDISIHPTEMDVLPHERSLPVRSGSLPLVQPKPDLLSIPSHESWTWSNPLSPVLPLRDSMRHDLGLQFSPHPSRHLLFSAPDQNRRWSRPTLTFRLTSSYFQLMIVVIPSGLVVSVVSGSKSAEERQLVENPIESRNMVGLTDIFVLCPVGIHSR